MTFVSGPYEWSAYIGAEWLTLGVIEDAPQLRFSEASETITGDNLGDSIQGIIYRGGNMYLDMVFQEYNLDAVKRLIWPWGDPVGSTHKVDAAANPAVGCLRSGVPLRGQKVAGGCAVPDLYWAKNAMLAPGFDISYLLGSRLRNVPISLLLGLWQDVDPGGGTQYVDFLAGDSKWKWIGEETA